MLSRAGGPLGPPYGFVVALAAEARAFGRPPRGRGVALPGGHWLGVCGMGAARARDMGLDLAARDVRTLVSFGTCGGLAPGLSAGSLLCPRTVCDEQGTCYPTDVPPDLAEGLAMARVVDVLLSVTVPVYDVARKEDLFRRYGAAGVDMESAALARVASERGLRFVALRAVVDAHDEPLPMRLLAAVDEWGRPRAMAIMRALATDPATWVPAARLGRHMARAQKTLAAAAAIAMRATPR
ncbi:MAG: phosphorylase family protein [Acidiferrobacter sp.]